MDSTVIKQIGAVNRKYLYGHQATISRQQKKSQPDGSTRSIWTVVLENVSCRLSKKGLDGGKLHEDVKAIRESFTLFCAPDIVIKAGDLVGIGGKQYVSGEPFGYPTHQEIPLMRRDLA